MKPIYKVYDSTGTKYIPVDLYADRGVSFNVVSGTATVDTTISDFNSGNPISALAATVTSPIDHPITGLIINVTVQPCIVEVAQHGT